MHDRTTRNIANNGFIGIQRVVARFNFSCASTGNHSQSAPNHILGPLGKIFRNKNFQRYGKNKCKRHRSLNTKNKRF